MTEEEEFEESLVFVELNGIIDGDWLAKDDIKCKIVGLESETPVLQLDRYVFIGEYQDAIGTSVFFEKNVNNSEDSVSETSDEENSSNKPKCQLKYICNTHKKLFMKRTFLSEKEEKKDSRETVKSTEKSSGDKVSTSTEGDKSTAVELEPKTTSPAMETGSETEIIATPDASVVAPPSGQVFSSSPDPCPGAAEETPPCVKETVELMDISLD